MKHFFALFFLVLILACSQNGAHGLDVFVGQSVPSLVSYGFDENHQAYSIRDGKQQPLGFSNQKMTKHVQSGNELYVFDMLESQEVTKYTDVGEVEKIKLSLSGPLFFLEAVPSGFITGSFQENRILIYGLNHEGGILASEFLEAEVKQILYTNGQMFSAWSGERLHLWVPTYNKYLVMDEALTVLENIDLPFPSELIAFDGYAMPKFFEANEKLSLEELRAYARERVGTVLQVRPISMFLRDGRPFYLFSTIVIGEGLNHEGKPELKYFTKLLDMHGNELKSEEGDALGFHNEAIVIQYMVEDVPHRKFVTL